MTICKLLKPESMAKIRALAISGVRLEAKRCKSVQHPELEQCLYAAVGMGARRTSKKEILAKAEELAQEMNIADWKTDNGWCNRFINQHDLYLTSSSVASRRHAVSSRTGQSVAPTVCHAIRVE